MNKTVEFVGQKYRVNGIEMNVVIEGQGPDVLLVHGFPDSIAGKLFLFRSLINPN